ncbi:hypothetical protein CROQUDRAFT_673275 [Cronartium quercuum f. sp. fusiforme G11]|uniref:Uncharacterized protein n=1 Tax=Cronartium quercuum f. sp. fusiforme G11 TaxID=708437 RepID=A0A9P6NFU1_9BASI|nr:hypothetical protein CROQUDRAFT_673275 [Cronartium quercuum f. sp. fusiforme G11]
MRSTWYLLASIALLGFMEVVSIPSSGQRIDRRSISSNLNRRAHCQAGMECWSPSISNISARGPIPGADSRSGDPCKFDQNLASCGNVGTQA